VFSSSDPGDAVGGTVNGGGGIYTASIRSSTTVGPATITATDGGVGGQASLSQTSVPATTSLGISNATPSTGNKVTFTATVTGRAGLPAPTGVVAFMDGGRTMAICATQPLKGSTATCTHSYSSAGTHEISAQYLGDAHFAGSTSGVAEVSVHKSSKPPPTRMLVTMQWEFHFTPHYTTILQFFVNGVPKGANVMVSCKGHGCPYARHTLALIKRTVCKTTKKTKKCTVQQPSSTVHLQPPFGNRRLGVGAKVTVNITKAGYIGKHYVFTIVARKAPRVSIGCLTPGANKPESCPS
jgi:hypothetical protein